MKKVISKYLFLLIVIFVLIITPYFLFKIKKVECQTQYGSCPNELISGVSTKKEIKKKLDDSILVNSYILQYQIPSILKVSVNIKEPVFAIYSLSNNKYYLIDQSGLILGETQNSSLPYIEKENSSIKIGERIIDSDLFLLRLIDKINRLYTIKYGKYLTNENSMSVRLPNGVTAFLPERGDVDVLIGSLRVIFSRLNDDEQGIKMGDISEIDLRFKNPVLR